MNKIIVFFSLCSLLYSCGQDEIPPRYPLEKGFSFELFNTSSIQDIPSFNIRESGQCQVNLNITSKDNRVDIYEMLELTNPRMNKQNISSKINFNIKNAFKLILNDSLTIPCALYHVEPYAFEQKGLKMVLLFNIGVVEFQNKENMEGTLFIHSSIFNKQTAQLPINITYTLTN